MKRVVINGFGCIGCFVFCYFLDINNKEVEIVVVNDLIELKMFVYLLKYDIVFGLLKVDVIVKDDVFVVNGKVIKVFFEKDFVLLFWKEFNIDIVLECIGFFVKKDFVYKYIDVGVKKVIILVFVGKDVKIVVYGVNYEILFVDDEIILGVLCIINCLVFVVKVLVDNFGIENGFMIIVYLFIGD